MSQTGLCRPAVSADILFLSRCVENIGDQPAVVLEKFCDSVARPDTREDCYEPCPGHCVVSQWSQWSHCTEVRQLNITNLEKFP